MSMSYQQVMTPRMQLEQKLEQNLSMKQVMQINLTQYLEQEKIIQGLIRYASDNNTWTEFDRDGFQFSYARVPYELAKPIADKYGFGFAHALYDPFEAFFGDKTTALARGAWTLFVVEDKVPKEFHDIVAIHERGEQLSLGNHFFASKLEFAYTQSRRLLRSYTKFIDDYAPQKFIDLAQKVHFPIFPDEFKDWLRSTQIKIPEIERAEQLIERRPLPSSVLRKMSRYQDFTNQISEQLRDCTGPFQNWLYLNREHEIDIAADKLNSALCDVLKSIPPTKARVVSDAQLDGALRSFQSIINDDFRSYFKRNLQIPSTFREAYIKAREGTVIVQPLLTIEDKIRRDERENSLSISTLPVIPQP